VTKVKGIKGLASGVFYDNIWPSFLENGQFISYGKNAVDIENTSGQSYNQIMADITTSFTLLIGIFFPSVTGWYYLAYRNLKLYNTFYEQASWLDPTDRVTLLTPRKAYPSERYVPF